MSYSIGFDIFAKDKASATFDKLGKKVGDTESKFSKHSAKMKLAVAAVGVAVVKFGSDSVDAYVDAEAQQRVLTDAYARFPALADVSVQALRDQAQALQSVTKFDGDATAAAMGTLAQFKLTGKQVQDLTPLMLDYAQKTGKDLPTAAADLGKAMLGQGKALKEVGIKFTDLKNPTKNYEQLMGGLRKQVGGFAQKEGKEAEGRAAILKNKFGDLQETVGSKLQPALEKMTDAGIKVVDWMSKNEGKVKALGIAVGVTALAFGVGTVVVSAHGLALTIAATGGLKAFIMGSRIATAGMWLFNGALAVATSPITLVVVAIALLAAGLVLAYKKSETFRNIVDGAFRGIASAATWMWNTVLQPVITGIIKGYGRVFTAIGTVLSALGNVPGFEWAKTAGAKMLAAGGAADRLAASIRKIDPYKKVTVETYFKVTGSILASQNARLKGRASGGPVKAGTSYLINEEGQEIFTPTTDGQVTNARDTARLLAGRGGSSAGVGGGGSSIVINVNGALDPNGVARQIQTILKQLKRNTAGELGLA